MIVSGRNNVNLAVATANTW